MNISHAPHRALNIPEILSAILFYALGSRSCPDDYQSTTNAHYLSPLLVCRAWYRAGQCHVVREVMDEAEWSPDWVVQDFGAWGLVYWENVFHQFMNRACRRFRITTELKPGTFLPPLHTLHPHEITTWEQMCHIASVSTAEDSMQAGQIKEVFIEGREAQNAAISLLSIPRIGPFLTLLSLGPGDAISIDITQFFPDNDSDPAAAQPNNTTRLHLPHLQHLYLQTALIYPIPKSWKAGSRPALRTLCLTDVGIGSTCLPHLLKVLTGSTTERVTVMNIRFLDWNPRALRFVPQKLLFNLAKRAPASYTVNWKSFASKISTNVSHVKKRLKHVTTIDVGSDQDGVVRLRYGQPSNPPLSSTNLTLRPFSLGNGNPPPLAIVGTTPEIVQDDVLIRLELHGHPADFPYRSLHLFLCSNQAVNLEEFLIPNLRFPVARLCQSPSVFHMGSSSWTCRRLHTLAIGFDCGASKSQSFCNSLDHQSRIIFGFIAANFQRLVRLDIMRSNLVAGSSANGFCFLTRLPFLERLVLRVSEWQRSFLLSDHVEEGTSCSSISRKSSSSGGDKDTRRARLIALLSRGHHHYHNPTSFSTGSGTTHPRWICRAPSDDDMEQGVSSLSFCRRIYQLDTLNGTHPALGNELWKQGSEDTAALHEGCRWHRLKLLEVQLSSIRSENDALLRQDEAVLQALLPGVQVSIGKQWIDPCLS